MGASETKSKIIIFLVGKTGDGKSSTGNTILGKQIFKSESSPISKTKDFDIGNEMVNGINIKIIDTPGIFDTSHDEYDTKEKLISALVECAPEPYVFTIVLKIGKHTSQEEKIEEKIVEYLNECNLKYSVVLFTHGEQLEGQTIEEFVKKSPKLQELVDKCGGHCHVIDNKYWNSRWWEYRSNRVQVKNLLRTIDQMVKQKGSYTNELLEIVEEEIQKEIENIKEDNLSSEEKQEKAKNAVYKKLLIRFAGVTAGTLTGAILGICVPVASLVALVKGVKKTGFDAKEDKVAVAAATGGAAAVGTAAISALAGVAEAVIAAEAGAAVATAAAGTVTALEAGVAAGAAAAVGATAVEAGVAAGAAAAAVEAGVAAGAAGVAAAEAGVAAGAGIGAAAGSGIAVGVIFGAAAVAGAIRGGITGYRAVAEANSVLDAIRLAARANIENTRSVIEKAEQLPSNVCNKFKK